MLERAIDKAEDAANRNCEHGHCVGEIKVISVSSQNVNWPGRPPTPVCVWTVSVQLDGKCGPGG